MVGIIWVGRNSVDRGRTGSSVSVSETVDVWSM